MKRLPQASNCQPEAHTHLSSFVVRSGHNGGIAHPLTSPVHMRQCHGEKAMGQGRGDAHRHRTRSHVSHPPDRILTVSSLDADRGEERHVPTDQARAYCRAKVSTCFHVTFVVLPVIRLMP